MVEGIGEWFLPVVMKQELWGAVCDADEDGITALSSGQGSKRGYGIIFQDVPYGDRSD
ncbi:hypothetical protein L950_0222030 [Sphingobacterium sp. IITKGP-BTPF85]|nr:hypothetical protein L950_0222030 [Sphingobacterium sp. IITKGP-BTPF85]